MITTETNYKFMHFIGQDYRTTAEIAEKLDITIRSANRHIKLLKEMIMIHDLPDYKLLIIPGKYKDNVRKIKLEINQ